MRWLEFTLGLSLVVGAARAEMPEGYRLSSRGTREAVRAVVDAQLDAFAADNGAAAYAFAGRAIRRQFAPEVFVEMIRRGYPALLRHSRRELGLVRDNREGRAMVDVTVVDAQGKVARFRYQLVEERDVWRVEGVLPIRAATRGEL